MNKLFVAALALAACGNHGARPAQAEAQVVASPTTPPPEPAGSAVVQVGRQREAIAAPHGGAIVALAATPDGTAAVSCDELGGIRLWPTLDGSHEPHVVDLAEPKELAISPRSDGFTIVALDEGGGVIVDDVDRDGRRRSHVTLPADPEALGLAMTALGALVWRSDQTLALIGADARIKRTIGTEPGQRLVAVAAAGRHAAAIVEVDGKRRVRAITLEPQLAWGSWLEGGKHVGSVLALSPSGTRIAMLELDPPGVNKTANPPQVIAVDVTTGKELANDPAPDALSIAFADDDHLAVGVVGIAWLDLAVGTPPLSPVTPTGAATPQGMLAPAAGKVITAAGGELVLARANALQFLGYAIESPSVSAAAADGQLLVGLGDVFVLLDHKLAVSAVPTFTLPSGTSIAELRWLAGDDWLVEASRIVDGASLLSLVDVARKHGDVFRTDMSVVPLSLYEPSTGLITLSLDDQPEIDRYSATTHKIERVATLPKSKTYRQQELIPVAPALSGGTQLVHVTMPSPTKIDWLRDPRSVDHATQTVTLDGSLAGGDAAGHVYVWRNSPAGQLELAVYERGKPIGVLPTQGPIGLWPDPEGTRLVEVGQRDVALYKVDGTKLWAVDLAGTTQAIWLSDGAIALISAAGVARVDPATGAVTAARCGWQFELSSKPHPATPRLEPVCAGLR